MTNAFASAFDEMAHSAFRDAGMADVAMFQPRVGAPVAAVRVYVDRDMADASLAGVDVLKDQALIRVVKGDLASAPRQGDAFAIGTETFIVQRRLMNDVGHWVLLCQA